MPAILEIIPEINKIKDENLKQKVIATWELALAKGGWDISDLENIPFTLLIKDSSISFLDHTRAVTLTSIAISEVFKTIYKKTLNYDLLIAGAILHDVGKLVEYSKKNQDYTKSQHGKYVRHPFSGVSLAEACHLPPEVLHIIAAHSKEGDLGPRSAEAIIIHHADFVNFEPFKADCLK